MSLPTFKINALLRHNWPYVIALLIAIPVLVWVSPKYIKMHDEGMLSSAAMLLAGGKTLYGEVFEFWPPISLYLTAAVFKVFDVSVLSLRLLVALLILANLTWFYVILRKMRQGSVFELGSLLAFLIISTAFVGMSHHLVGMLFLLICMYALIKFLETNSRWLAAMSGFLASLCLLSMQFEGVVAIALCGVVLLLQLQKSKEVVLPNFGSMSIGFLVPISLTVAYFAYMGNLEQFLYATVVFPLNQYKEVNNSLEPLVLAIQLCITLGLGWWWIKQRSNSAVNVWVLGCILIQLAVLFTSNNSLLVRYAFFGSVVWFGVLIELARQYKRSPAHIFTINSENIKPLVVVVLLLIFVVFPGNIRIMLETAASWRNIALAAHKIDTPAGTMYARSEQAAKTQEIIDYVQESVGEHESIYFGPYSGHYSFLTNRVSPIGYSQLTPGYNPEWMFEDAMRSLRESKTNHIVFLPQESSFAFTADNDLSKYVLENYTVVKPLPYVTLLSSKSIYQYTYKQQLQNTPTDAIWQLKGE